MLCNGLSAQKIVLENAGAPGKDGVSRSTNPALLRASSEKNLLQKGKGDFFDVVNCLKLKPGQRFPD